MLHFSILRCRQYTNTIIRAAFSSKKGDPSKPVSSSSSSSSSDSDDERRVAHKNRSDQAREKLHSLLTTMLEDDNKKSVDTTLPLAKAKDHKKNKIKTEPNTESVTTEIVEKQVVKAVQDVAESLGGNVKKTESELLQKLLNPLKEETQQPTVTDLVELFKDMPIDRETKTDTNSSRAEQVRHLLQLVKTRQPDASGRPVKRKARVPYVSEADITNEPVNLHIEERLGIFKANDVKTWSSPDLNPTWKMLHQRELELSVTHPPENYFQQMILWTNQGKIWRFPIDNEQDWPDEEKNVYFTEHIFLEKHLEGWCPSKGPIRHFMELVCVGLSKNSYLTAQMKRDHIHWFRDYFREKKELLREVGALPPGFDIDSGKKIEAK